MKSKALFFILFFMTLLNSNAITHNYRAIYDYEYTKDSINSIRGKDVLYLDISEDISFCFSYYSYQVDSLKSEPNGRKVWRELFSAAIAKDGINATSFPHKRSTFKITKYNKEDTIYIKDVVDNDIYCYEVSKTEFNWNICDSIKYIKGFKSYKARCNYHGREWHVWFTPDIPFNDGPWVLCGLPGLILEAQDKDRLFLFKIIGVTSNQALKKDWSEDGKKTNRLTFLRKQYNYLRNLNSIFNAKMGTNIQYNRDTRYLDGLEPDFKMQRANN